LTQFYDFFAGYQILSAEALMEINRDQDAKSFIASRVSTWSITADAVRWL
jgi:hypothetical protein